MAKKKTPVYCAVCREPTLPPDNGSSETICAKCLPKGDKKSRAQCHCGAEYVFDNDDETLMLHGDLSPAKVIGGEKKRGVIKINACQKCDPERRVIDMGITIHISDQPVF